MFSIWFTSSATAALPIDSIGCLSGVRLLLPPDMAAWLRTVRR